MAEAHPMSSDQPQQTDGPKVTFRESWHWHAAEEAAPPKLNVVALLKFFGLTTTSKSEPDALTVRAGQGEVRAGCPNDCNGV